jgi:peroxiredoxin (alkyl hydroperoxide reductase subunit C)
MGFSLSLKHAYDLKDITRTIKKKEKIMGVLVGRPAPLFKADAVLNGKDFGELELVSYRNKKNVILFFYPLDFTFVCPTELHAFQEKLSEFHSRNTEVIGCSIDSKFSHHAWLNTPKAKGGIQGITYPLVSDIYRVIARDYDVLSEGGVAFRGLFLIDIHGVVRHQLVNDLPLGRSVEEALRLIDALDHFEKHGEVCPANWTKGQEAFTPDSQGVSSYLSHKK